MPVLSLSKGAGSLRSVPAVPFFVGAGAEQRESDVQHGASPPNGGRPTTIIVVMY